MKFHKIKRIFSVSTFAVVFCLYAAARADGQTAPSAAESITETFELNIADKHITETNFARSTAVELTGQTPANVRLEVGVGVRADRIDVLLRGVFGRVTFRGSLDALRRRIEQNRRVNQPPAENPLTKTN